MNNDNPQTIQDVEALAAKYGITFSAEDYLEAQSRAEQRRAQLAAEGIDASAGSTLVDRFNRWYPRFLNALLGIGDVLITMTQTILIAFGVPGVLLMLLIVEQQRVFYGVSLFEVHGALAAFSATALVVLNLILELMISWVEHRARWQEPARHEFSFRLLAQRLAYMIGRSTDWQPRPKSPALRLKVVLRIVTFSILTLALAGSMRTVIEHTAGNWLEALRFVVAESTHLELSTWMGRLLFALAAVLSAQALSQYVARKVIEIVEIMQSSADDKPRQIAEASGLTAAMFLYARLKEAQKLRRTAGAVAVAQDRPTATVGLSGTLPFTDLSVGTPVMAQTTEKSSEHDRTEGLAAGQEGPKPTKIQQAVDMLTRDRTLRRLTTRELEARTGIGRNTWATAKKRLGL